ncbi:hypothetical protein CBL_04431 [Carabus blaptoides fortunei]
MSRTSCMKTAKPLLIIRQLLSIIRLAMVELFGMAHATAQGMDLVMDQEAQEMVQKTAQEMVQKAQEMDLVMDQ